MSADATAPTPLIWQADAHGQLQPYSPLFDDIYRSSGQDGLGGLAQARHSFLMGCGLLAGDMADSPLWQGQKNWHILETGFGLGLNFLATWQAWLQDGKRPQHLIYSAAEAYPVSAADILQSTAVFPALAPMAAQLAAAWQPQAGINIWRFADGALELRLYMGDVLAAMPHFHAPIHSVFLDGFKPKTNAAMWSADCIQAIARLLQSGSRLASWTAAGAVRQRLTDAGLGVGKRPGLPPKRHSLWAIYP